MQRDERRPVITTSTFLGKGDTHLLVSYTPAVLLGQWQMWRYIKARNNPVVAVHLSIIQKVELQQHGSDHCSILKSDSKIIGLFLKFLCSGNTLTHRKEVLLSPFSGNILYWQGKYDEKSGVFLGPQMFLFIMSIHQADFIKLLHDVLHLDF